MLFHRSSHDGTHVFSRGDKHLLISNSSISLEDDLPEVYSKIPKSPICGLLGTIKLKLHKYIIIVTSQTISGNILKNDVARADTFEVIPLSKSQVKDQDEEKYLELLHLQLKASPLYYSVGNGYDLTVSLQHQITGKVAINSENEFWWNQYLSSDIPKEAINDFCIRAIYGYFKSHLIQAPDHRTFEFALLTRRSIHRTGTRYFRRGIDLNGHVANFNETEQFIVANKFENEKPTTRVYSFLQIRGSVPVYWAQINNLKYSPKLAISSKSSVDATEKHFDDVTNKYGDVVCVNLVNQKGYEKPVKEAFESAVECLPEPLAEKVKYIYFDFHHECRGMRWDRVELLLKHLIDLGYTSNEYFEYDLDTKKTINVQKKIVRTNCMDCLDRTNVVQSTLAKWVLQTQLTKCGYLSETGSAPWSISIPSFLPIFQNFWADNADAVSCSYSGTGALKTDFTRTGKRTKKGAFNDLLNSITRYYKNNYSDGERQDSFDLILGRYKPFQGSFNSPFVDRRPPHIQLLPFIWGTSLFVFLTILLFPRGNLTDWKNLLIISASLFVNIKSLLYIIDEGYQFVNWPRLEHLDYLRKVDVFDGSGKSVGYKYEENDSFCIKYGKKKN